MKLSDKLQIDHDCGDFGKALEGYAQEAEELELKIVGLQVELRNIYYHEACQQGAGHQVASKYAKDRLDGKP